MCATRQDKRRTRVNFSEIKPIALSTPIQKRLLLCDQIGSFSTDDGKKTSLENKHLRNCNYFAIIPSCSHFTIGSLRWLTAVL